MKYYCAIYFKTLKKNNKPQFICMQLIFKPFKVIISLNEYNISWNNKLQTLKHTN